MKTKLSLCFALLALTSAQAQIFRSEAVNGAVLGGIAGAVIGHNSGDLRHNGWRGAAIGSAAGLLIGQAIGDANAHRYGRSHGEYIYRSSPRVHVGIGYSHGGYRHGGHFGHRGHVGHYGHNRWHHGHRGWGWGVSYAPSFGYYRGYGLGYPHISYDDYVYRTPSHAVPYPTPAVVQSAPAPVQAPAPAPAPQQVTIINNYYNSSPMSAANGLFGR